MTIRPYQTRSIEMLRSGYASGYRSQLLVLPTGGGKTHIAAEIIRAAIAKGRHVAFLAHRQELIDQSVRKLKSVGIESIRVIKAQRDEGEAPITVASVQTIAMPKWATKMPEAGLVIFDEAHHIKARTWAGIAARYPNASLLGLTATPARADSSALGDIFENLVVGATIAELTELEHLVPARTFAPSEVLRAAQLASSPVDAYERYGNGERAIVFASTVDHAASIANEFTARGIPAESVTGESKDRDAILQRFATGQTRVLASVNVLVEGFDDPGASVAILARRFGHVGAYVQAVGRVLRPAPGKSQATVIDLCGSALVHGTPDTEREYSLEGKGIRLKDRLALKQCPTCGGVEKLSARTECSSCGAPYPVAHRPEVAVVNASLSELAPKTQPRRWVVKLVAKFPGVCGLCQQGIAKGEVISWVKGEKPRHLTCRERTMAA